MYIFFIFANNIWSILVHWVWLGGWELHSKCYGAVLWICG